MDDDEVVRKSLEGDEDSIKKLVMIQRQGRKVRIYPTGRKGPLDEGVMPFLITRSPTNLVRLSFGRSPNFKVEAKDVGKYIKGIMANTACMVQSYIGNVADSSSEQRAKRMFAIEAQVTPDLDWIMFLVPDGIEINMLPAHVRDFDIGLYHSMGFVAHWMQLIEDSDMPLSEWGIDNKLINDISVFIRNYKENS